MAFETSPALTDPERHFHTDHLRASLKTHSVRGGAVLLVARSCKIVVQLVATVLLARLLTPEDYGLLAMVTAITGFVALFNEPHLSFATVQRPHLNHKQVSTLFWINTGLGCALALTTAVLAPVISWFYSDPRLTWIALALASGFIFAGLGRQHHALLKRQMRFGPLVAVEIISMLVGIAAAVISAWHGAQYWALVLMHLANGMANALGLWIACGWRPGRPVRHSGVRSMLAFGGHLTGFHILNYLSTQSASVLIGWYWGAQQLGLYYKAHRLLLLPLQQFSAPVSSVAVPALSRLQDNPTRYCAYYDKSILLLSTFSMPLVAFLFVTADTVIPLVLGAQWEPTVPIFRALAPATFLQAFTAAIWWISASMGRTSREFYWTLGVSIMTLMSFFIGVQWGAIGVAVALSASRVIAAIPTLVFCCKHSPLQWIEIVKTVSRPALASIFAALALAAADRWLLFIANPIVDLTVNSLLYGLFYLAIWMVLPNGRHTLSGISSLITVLWRKQEARQV